MGKHFLVIGATGPSGISFLETSLQRGTDDLTIFCRNPSKLPQHIQTLALTKDATPKVQIVRGEFTETEAIKKAITTGATVLVSFAGPGIPAKGMPITEFYERLYPMILQAKENAECSIERVLVLSTPSFKVEEDKFSLKWWFGVWFVYLAFGDAYKEVNGIGNVTREKLGGSNVEYTVFRVPGLTNKPAGPVRAGYIGSKGDGLMLSRNSQAVWVLQEVQERKWVNGCPAISDA